VIKMTAFYFVDVFATEPLTGNPLALVPDADDLSEPQMRAIAREFNQSETTFLVRPARPEAEYRLRSFTPGGVEVAGAGHNALGAWIWLGESGRLPEGRSDFAQEIAGEVLSVAISSEPGGRVSVSMEQSAPEFGEQVGDHSSLLAALGLDSDDLSGGEQAQVVSTGAGHLLVPLSDRAAVDRAAPDQQKLFAALAAAGGEGCYVYSHDPVDADAAAYARFFNPTVGIAEDPATGTAAGPLVARLVAEGRVPEGEAAIVEQGHALGRPSRISVTVSGSRVEISGSGLVVAQGTLTL
jgi:trans-2,3-dihydro-3-hydroxyanthranilate isomerase